MDSQNRDESSERLREVALARRLGEALDRLSRARGECPEAELIAAYHERALEAKQSAECENHFAACSRCRRILAVLAASADVPLTDKEVANLGELASKFQPSAMPPPAPREKPQWYVDWRRWLAPALAAAAVVTVWTVMRAPWRQQQKPASVMVAEGPKTAPEAIPAPPSGELSAQLQPHRAANTVPTDKLKDQTMVGSLSAGGKRAGSGEAAARPGNAPVASGGVRAKVGVGGGAFVGVPASAAPPSPSPAPQASAQQVVNATGEAPEINAPANARLAPLAQREKKALPMNGTNYSVMLRAPAESGVPALMKSPSGRVLWRTGTAGRIEHSTDAGQTWRFEASPSQEDWLAGAAVSDAVCWLAGRDGAIARTVDGEHWEKITPPAISAYASGKFPDWVAVSASNAQIATVTAADNRRFTTRDAGRTWQTQ
jgi:hypothetical protein